MKRELKGRATIRTPTALVRFTPHPDEEGTESSGVIPRPSGVAEDSHRIPMKRELKGTNAGPKRCLRLDSHRIPMKRELKGLTKATTLARHPPIHTASR